MNDYNRIWRRTEWALGTGRSKCCAAAAFPPATGVGVANFDQAEG